METMSTGRLETEYNEGKIHDVRALMSKRDNSQDATMTFMEIATIVKQDMFDIDGMTTGMKKNLKSKVDVLQGHVDSMKPFVQKAKDNFKADRKRIRENYKACKKEIRKNDKTYKSTYQC